ncbi:hypothetical protein BGX34_003985 [Mortierella sp. NVP85]|nr:hypothetical protein BGX34_003985 [Mortierella sp. NVP85]
MVCTRPVQSSSYITLGTTAMNAIFTVAAFKNNDGAREQAIFWRQLQKDAEAAELTKKKVALVNRKVTQMAKKTRLCKAVESLQKFFEDLSEETLPIAANDELSKRLEAMSSERRDPIRTDNNALCKRLAIMP